MATARFKTSSPYLLPQTVPLSDPKCLPPTTGPSEPPLCVALIGLGRIGVMYLRHLRATPAISLRCVVISERQDAAEVRQQHGIPATVLVTTDPGLVYADASITAVVIASSTASHTQLILDSLAAGKAVYCEKPISTCLEETERCYNAAHGARLPLFCAFNRRFDPTYRHIQEQARRGAVGHIQTIKSVSRDSPIIPLQFIGPSGGIFDDFAVHDIDLLMWVTGDLPVQVFVSGNAQIAEFAEHHDYDNMIILLTFRAGTLGTIDLNRYSPYGYDQRLEVFGPLGMLHCEHSRPDTVVKHSESGSTKTPLFHSFPSHYDEAFRNEVLYFVEVVRGRAGLGVTEKMTRAVSKVVAACKESAKSGLPVKLEWSAEEQPEY